MRTIRQQGLAPVLVFGREQRPGGDARSGRPAAPASDSSYLCINGAAFLLAPLSRHDACGTVPGSGGNERVACRPPAERLRAVGLVDAVLPDGLPAQPPRAFLGAQ